LAFVTSASSSGPQTLVGESTLQGREARIQLFHTLSKFVMSAAPNSNGSNAMNVSLTPKLETFVKAKLKSGLYNNASEVLREALRLLQARDRAERGQLRHLRPDPAVRPRGVHCKARCRIEKTRVIHGARFPAARGAGRHAGHCALHRDDLGAPATRCLADGDRREARRARCQPEDRQAA
jgi:putative addiction module CopG family antidote